MGPDIIREALAVGEAFRARNAGLPVLTAPEPAEIRSHLSSAYPFRTRMNARDLAQDVGQMLETWAVNTTHPRYFGYFNPTPLDEAVAADLLAAFFNPQLAVWSHAPAAIEIEQHVLSWVTGKLGLPGTSAAHFTSGGSEANLTAAIVALTSRVPEYGAEGLSGTDARPTIVLSAGAHDSFTKICHMTGVGRAGLRVVPVDRSLRMDVAALRRTLEADVDAGARPVMVVATAGTTAAGVIDPMGEIAAICEEFDAWFHVDAAWGGAAMTSPVLRRHFDGLELADSVTCDAHKWFNVTMGAGMFFCRHPSVVREAFRVSTDYMPDLDQGSSDPFVESAQWSRRFIGLKLFMALAALGETGYAEMIEGQARLGGYMRRRLTERGWRHLSETPLPVSCVTHPSFEESPEALDGVLATVLERGRVWISKVRVADRQALRACITSRLATEADVDVLVEEMDRAVEAVVRGRS